MIIHREHPGQDCNLNIFQSIFGEKVYIRNDAQLVLDFIWNILHQLLCIADSNDSAIILLADINLTALRIGKAAYPFQIFVAPGFFPYLCSGFLPLCVHLHMFNVSALDICYPIIVRMNLRISHTTAAIGCRPINDTT